MLSASPGWAKVHHILGFIAAQSGRYPDAEAEYSETISLDPEHAAAHNDLGCVYARQARPA